MSAAINSAFRRVIILRNPVSTHADQAKQRIAEIRELFGAAQVEVIDTARGGAQSNRALLRKHARKLGPQTLLCIAAGDGTVGMVIETLVHDAGIPDEARRTPVLPLWSGNANDLAHMLNGNAYRNRLHEVLTNGTVIAVHPLACVLTPARGAPTTRIAACYASFGATAFAAARLNEPALRKNPLRRIPGIRHIVEFVAGFGALRNSPTFTVEEHGKTRNVYERTFTNGSRFAKVERLPLKLTDDAFLLHTLEEKRILTVLPRMWEAMQKRFVSRFRNERTEFTVQQDILAQFDGETAEIAAGTTVCITLSDRPFYALSLLLHESPPAVD
jgi:diacylglycerol kinase family enzyme